MGQHSQLFSPLSAAHDSFLTRNLHLLHLLSVPLTSYLTSFAQMSSKQMRPSSPSSFLPSLNFFSVPCVYSSFKPIRCCSACRTYIFSLPLRSLEHSHVRRERVISLLFGITYFIGLLSDECWYVFYLSMLFTPPFNPSFGEEFLSIPSPPLLTLTGLPLSLSRVQSFLLSLSGLGHSSLIFSVLDISLQFQPLL